MEEREKEEVFSQAVKAGKRTYFFDVKETKQGERYITITESKRKFDNEDGTFSYEKHKIFLYKEDYSKFQNALEGVIRFVETGQKSRVMMILKRNLKTSNSISDWHSFCLV